MVRNLQEIDDPVAAKREGTRDHHDLVDAPSGVSVSDPASSGFNLKRRALTADGRMRESSGGLLGVARRAIPAGRSYARL